MSVIQYWFRYGYFVLLLLLGRWGFFWCLYQAAALWRSSDDDDVRIVRMAIVGMLLSFACNMIGLYIFHRLKMLNPEPVVLVYTIYTIAHVMLAIFVYIRIAAEPYSKEGKSLIEFIVSFIMYFAIVILFEVIFSTPWFLQYFGLF